MTRHRHFGQHPRERDISISKDARDLRLATFWIAAAVGISLAANWLALLVCVRASLSFFWGGE